jgi:Cd2+/Zn2+-exporting ATPase
MSEIMIESHKTKVACLHCPTCSDDIEKAMLEVDGIIDIKLNFTTGMMDVKYDSEMISLDEIKSILDRQGCMLIEKEMEEEDVFSLENREFAFTLESGITLFIGLLVMFLTPDPEILTFYHEINISDILFIIAAMLGGYFVARSAFKGLLNRRFKIDSLMLIGATGAFLIDAFAEGAAVLFLFSMAELLEDYSVERSRDSLKELIDITPKTARVKRTAGFSNLPVEFVKLGDIVKIKPGEKIPIDGIVIRGSSSVNQAPITGESMPVGKDVDDVVFAGTINGQGVLFIKVTKVAKDTTLAKIIQMVETAESEKSPTERFIDRFAKYYTPSVVLFAVLVVVVPTFVFNQSFEVWFYKALLLLLISCPCALALSTPIAIASGITNGAKNGVLFKGGIYIENLAKVDTFAFDKTGTLTEGKPAVAEIENGPPEGRRKLLEVIASLEKNSTHPIGRAVVEYAEGKKIELLEVKKFRSIPGKGIKGDIGGITYFAGSKRLFGKNDLSKFNKTISRFESQGNTIVIVGTEGRVLGVLAIADKIRKSSKSMVSFLRKKGIKKTVMVTGDNETTASAVGARIGIDEVHAELLPDQKVEIIKKLSAGPGQVAMVGDGVNDAPALATADIGIAMGAAGSDTALEVADIALITDDLSRIPYLLSLGRKTMSVVKQNIMLAIGVKLLFAILVFPGLVTLWMAVAIGDMGVSLGVILNAFRLSRVK